ncbi:MAG TPA: T9SS type A sorting domain-containing protein [Chitinophagales bacterium]|nr:T9SS type A sorting domain-containing protein [Chitinophagales bacterium]
MKQLLLSLSVVFSLVTSAQITQPTQPATGPGGSEYIHGGVTQYDYGTNGSGGDFWLYEPNSPTPDSANVVIFIHGLGETNPKLYGAFIKHLVRKGNIVIYPRYQKDLNTSNTTFNDSCAHGIRRGLDTIQQPGHVKGRMENYFILGHSVGGVLTANMTMLHAQYGLPKPLTAFSMQPGAAGFLMPDYSAFPGDVKYLIAVGTEDVIVGTAPGTTLFNQTVNVPTSRKNLVTQRTDNHGNPSSDASHFAPLAGDVAFDNGESNLFILASGSGPVDGVDFYLYWKLQDALMDCALRNENCEYAFGDTPEQHGMGNWSDGTPVRLLEITPAAPTAINDINSNATISVYPNPSTVGNWQLTVSNYLLGSDVVVTDVNGSVIYTSAIKNSTTKISIDNAARAVYFYQLKTRSGELLKSGKLMME